MGGFCPLIKGLKMIFAKLRTDLLVQVDDMLRLDGSQSVISDFDEIKEIRIKPDALADFQIIEASEVKDIYLDWIYSDDGEKIATIEIEDINDVIYSKDFTLNVVSVEDDNLFSIDNDILPVEPDIYCYLPKGRSSFIYAHREAQYQIMAWLDEQRIWKRDGSRYKASDIKDIEEFRRWSKFLTLHIIYNSMSVAVDDLFQKKSEYYANIMVSARQRASLRLDHNEQGEPERLVDRVVSVQVRR